MIGVMPIEALDVLYLRSRDAQADVAFYRDVLGGRVVFAIEAMGTRVAEVSLGSEGPRLLLAEHLHGDAPILLHRVPSLDGALDELGARGQRIGLYELTRPEVTDHFAGRADFG
jgi:catechol 2,3-dioxygenase-like lactoylglutathione lyase family enzyme